MDLEDSRGKLFDSLFEHLQNDTLTKEKLNDAFCRGNNFEQIFAALNRSDCGGACGKVFSSGDYAYQCRTCQSDDTCIICVACFNDSEHVGHEVRMTFAHGGCCDCGDLESWKLEGTCSKHRPVDTVPDLPKDLNASVLEFVIYVLSSAFSCVNNIHFIPQKNNSNNDILIRWKEKMRDFETAENIGMHVGNGFLLRPGEQKYLWVRSMCTKGAPVAVVPKADWQRICSTGVGIKRVGDFLKGEEITKGHVLITYRMRELLFEWIDEVAAIHISVRKALGDQLMKSLGELNVSFSADEEDRPYRFDNTASVHYWVRDDFSLSETFRRQRMEPILFKLFAIPEFKMFFGRVFVQNYFELMRIWCIIPESTTRHENIIKVYSTIFSLGVQIFTLPGLVPKMLAEENFMDTLVKSMKLTIKHKTGSMQRIMHDLQYVLEIPDVLYTLIAEQNFLVQFLEIAELMQYKLPIVCKTGAHIEQEGDAWLDLLNAMNGVLRLATTHIAKPLDDILANAPTEQREILLQSTLSVIIRMMQSMCFPEQYNQARDRVDQIAPYPITTSPVSIYTPVSKIVSIILSKAMKYAPIRALDIHSPMIEYVDMCIIQIAILDQARAQIWVRNGNNPNRLIDCVGRWVFGESLALPDLSGAQLGACYIQPDQFIQRMLTRYGLINLLIPDATPDFGWKHFPIDKTQALVGFFLKSLVHIVSALPFINENEKQRKFILHWLASGGKNAQTMKASLGKDALSDQEFLQLLQEIGKMEVSSGLQQMSFDLKANQRKNFDPCFPWYMELTDRADAVANIKRIFELKKEVFTWWPRLHPAVFSQARRVLTSKRMSGILRLVLWSCCEAQHTTASKETLVDALALICHAIECCLCGEFSDEDRGLVMSWICGTSPFVFWTQEQMEQIAPSQPSGGSQDSMQNMMNIFNRIAQLRNIGGRVVGNMNNMLQLGRHSRNEDGDSPASEGGFEDVGEPVTNKEESVLQLLNRLMKKDKNQQIALIFRKLAELCEKFDEPVLSAALFEDIGFVADNAKTAMKKAKKSKKKRKKAERARLRAKKMIQNMSDGFERRHKVELEDLKDEAGQEKKNEERFGVGAKRACVICRSYENQEQMGMMCFLERSKCVPIMMALQPEDRGSSLSTCSHVIHVECHKQLGPDRFNFLRKNESKCPLCGAVFNSLVPFVHEITPHPQLKLSYCTPAVNLNEFFQFWDSFDIGKKHEPTVSQDINKDFRERIEDALSNAVPLEKSLLSALHYALKGDEGLCRLTPPSQDKFYRLFSSLMSIVTYHWDSFQKPAQMEFFWSNFWKRHGIPKAVENMKIEEEEELQSSDADPTNAPAELINLSSILSPDSAENEENLVQQIEHLISSQPFRMASSDILSDEDSESLQKQQPVDTIGLYDVDACKSLLECVLAYPQSFYLENNDSDAMDAEPEMGYAFIVTSVEANGEPQEDKSVTLLVNGEDVGSAKTGEFVLLPSNVNAENVKISVPEGTSPVKLEINDHYTMLQDDSDLFYRIRRPPNEHSTALHRMLQSCYIVHLLQCLLQSGCADEMDKLEDINESYCVLDIFQRVHGSFDKERFQNLLLPFLRYVAILWHGLGLIQLDPATAWPGSVDFLLSLLSLPSYMSIISEQTHPRLSKLFLHYVNVQELPQIDPNELPSLVQLPSSYSEIFQEVSNFNAESKKELLICLFCGVRIELPEQKGDRYDRGFAVEKFSAARNHVQARCTGYCGMFLRTREREATQILITKRGKMAHISSPYVDSFGCTDHGLYRGKLLSLDARRYKFLTEIAISRDTQNFVLRNLQPKLWRGMAQALDSDDE